MNLKPRILDLLNGAAGPMTITELSERLDATYSMILESLEQLEARGMIELRSSGGRGKFVSLKTRESDTEPMPVRKVGNKLKITIEIVAADGEYWYEIKHHPQIWESAQVEGSGTGNHVRGTIRALARVLVDRFLDGVRE
jgi:DNA-binding transcriptional ArsR family regulator